MFNTLREELNKISLMEDDELEMLSNNIMDGDEGAADDELYDDIEEGEEEEYLDDIDGGDAINEAIDTIINEMLINESYSDGYFDEEDDYDYYNEEEDDIFDDDYDDDDFDDDSDEVDMDYGVIGDGRTVKGDPDDDEYDEVDIGGVTNAVHGDVDLKEDIDDDEEDDLDELLEAMLMEECDGSDEHCDHTVRATQNDIFGDSADMPDRDTPPAPQYSRLYARNKVGGSVANYGAGNYKKFGKSYFDSNVMGAMTVDDDEYDEEGNAYDLYSSAGNIYDDDENEEYYGIRNKVATKNLYGRHNINNINYAQLGDRFSGTKDALDESIEAFLNGLDY